MPKSVRASPVRLALAGAVVISPVFDENQFGTRKVTISQTRWLCVPSTKKVIG